MKRVLLTVFMLLSVIAPATAENVDAVMLHEKAFVSGECIYLKDIATVQGPNEKDLAVVGIMKSPAGPSGVNLSSDYIGRKIQESHPGLKVVMKGSPKVTVQEKLLKISGEELEEFYREAVKKNSTWKDKGSLVIKDVKTPKFVLVPEKDKELVQAKFSPHEDFLGLTSAVITFGSGSSGSTARVSGKVQIIADVPAAKANIPRGAIISEADLEMRQVDISASPLILTDSKDCLGMRAKTMLQAGRPINKSNIEQPPMVNRGDVVAIEARSKGLVIRDMGIALKDGYFHERIPVKNASSGKQILGTIIAASLVEVTF